MFWMIDLQLARCGYKSHLCHLLEIWPGQVTKTSVRTPVWLLCSKRRAETLSMEFLNNIQVSVFITLQRIYQGPVMARVLGKYFTEKLNLQAFCIITQLNIRASFLLVGCFSWLSTERLKIMGIGIQPHHLSLLVRRGEQAQQDMRFIYFLLL